MISLVMRMSYIKSVITPAIFLNNNVTEFAKKKKEIVRAGGGGELALLYANNIELVKWANE